MLRELSFTAADSIEDFTGLALIVIINRLKLNKKTGQTDNNGTKDVEIIVPLKYQSNS